MKTVLLVLGGIIALVIIGVVWLGTRASILTSRREGILMAEVQPLLDAVEKGETPIQEINALAERPDTRSRLYRALHDIGRTDLFPDEHKTTEQIAESDMVAWLLHPNELNAIPDEIEVGKVIERTEGSPSQRNLYYVFRFRTRPPQWAADYGWMAGVAGPYVEGKEPIEFPSCLFSELEPYDSLTPEEHLDKLLKIIRGAQGG